MTLFWVRLRTELEEHQSNKHNILQSCAPKKHEGRRDVMWPSKDEAKSMKIIH